MAALLIIVLLTMGLASRAGLFGARRVPSDTERTVDTGLFDACARTLVLVLLSLLGLLALGVMYGNVLEPGVVDLSTVK